MQLALIKICLRMNFFADTSAATTTFYRLYSTILAKNEQVMESNPSGG